MQALALKYRPKNYDELIGQDMIAKSLSHALDTKRLSHAYLFSGLRGSGKTSSARIFAKALVCDEGPTSTPCEKCPNCLMANEGRHLDIIEMDAASHRKIDDIRELIEQTKYAPAAARYKVFIIDEVHMLTKEAFNALLKTLEEPPQYVKFILATTDPLKLPPTVLSRTQHFRFKPIAKNSIIAHLKHILENEDINYDNQALEILARSGSGSLRDTLTLLDQAIIFSAEDVNVSAVADMLGLLDPGKIDEILDIIVKQDRNMAIDVIKELEEYDAETIIDEMIANLKERFLKRDLKFSLLMYERFFRILSESKSMLSINTDSGFTLCMAIFMMMEAVNLKNIDELIEASKSVEKKSTISNENETPYEQKQKNLDDEKRKSTVSSKDIYKTFLDNIYDRDYDLGRCFEECVEFIKFDNNTLYLISKAKDNNKTILRNASKAIMDVLRKTFNVKTKIKIEQNEENLKPNLPYADKKEQSLQTIKDEPGFDERLDRSLEKFSKLKNNIATDKEMRKQESIKALNEIEPVSFGVVKDENTSLIKELDRLFGKPNIIKE